jgi:nitrilase
MKNFRASVIQAGSIPFNTQKSLNKACTLISEASGQGARLVVFPEAFISAYPKGVDFGARVGMRSNDGRNDFQLYWESSINVPSSATDTLGKAAKKNDVYLVIGVIERDVGTLYCTALFFSPDGVLMGKHRKLMPTAMERLIWGFGDGSTLPVFNTELGRLGSVICWENYMPMLRMHMYYKGIQLYCAPTVDDRDTCIPTMRHIAVEGRCFVFSSCQYIKREAYPENYNAIQGNDPSTILIRGGSCIVNPFGQVIAGPDYDGECILTADIDLDDIVRGKYDLDATGHYARPDIFHLNVNEKVASPVMIYSDRVKNPFELNQNESKKL